MIIIHTVKLLMEIWAPFELTNIPTICTRLLISLANSTASLNLSILHLNLTVFFEKDESKLKYSGGAITGEKEFDVDDIL